MRRGITTLGAALALACAVPAVPRAEAGAVEVAELIARPPGCLQLRYLVMKRMAAPNKSFWTRKQRRIRPQGAEMKKPE